MKFLKAAGAHLRRACIYFTVFQFAVTAIFQITAQNGGRGQFLIFTVELAVFAFSVALAFAEDILRINNLSLYLRILLHFLCCAAAVILLFRIVAGDMFRANSLLFIAAGFILLYAVAAAVVLIIKRIKDGKKSDESEYTSQFKGKNQ